MNAVADSGRHAPDRMSAADRADDVRTTRHATAITPVVMCGGAGTRLWPASRESMPKQFIPLVGDLSSFQLTAQRLCHPSFGKPIILASSDVRFVVAEQLQQVGVEADIVLEPSRRDSAAAVAVATCLASEKSPDAILLVVAADHLIKDAESFVSACLAAADAARLGFVMTLGVEPTEPATGFGCIQPGETIGETSAAKVVRFVEKPDAGAAKDYVDRGFLWNSGNFVFRADVMLEEFGTHAPEVLAPRNRRSTPPPSISISGVWRRRPSRWHRRLRSIMR